MIETTTEETELKHSSTAVTYGVPIGIVVVIAIGVVWFIWRRRQAVDKNGVSDHTYIRRNRTTNQ